MRSAHQSALMKDAGVRWMTSVFHVGISDSADSVSIVVKQCLECTQVDQENVGIAIPSVGITALGM